MATPIASMVSVGYPSVGVEPRVKSEQPHRFAVLDAWRGVAACLVVIYHFISWPGLRSHFFESDFLRNGGMMVDFFFVLSGFVISHAALGKISDGRSAATFLIRRFGRLWPLHAAVLAVFVTLALTKAVVSRGALPAFGPYNSLASVFYNLLMIHSLDVEKWPMWNTPSWSVSVEFYTYFIFVGVCLMARYWRVSTILSAIFLILMSLTVLARWGSMGMTIDFGIFRCIYGFFIGHLTYLVWRHRKMRVALVEWLAVALVVAVLSFSGYTLVQYAAPLAYAFVIWVFAEEVGSVSRFGKTAPLQMLGLLSYSIYMTHWLGIYAISRVFPWIDSRFGTRTVFRLMTKSLDIGQPDVAMPILAMPNYWVGDAATLLFLAVFILFSSQTYRYIEHPARLYFNRLAGGKGAHVSRSSAAV